MHLYDLKLIYADKFMVIDAVKDLLGRSLGAGFDETEYLFTIHFFRRCIDHVRNDIFR